MKIYTVHIDAKHNAPIDDAVFIKEGFSVWAFLFHMLWLAYHRTWMWAGIVLAFFLIAGALEQQELVPVVYSAIAQFGFQIYIGLTGQDWRRKALDARGFTFAGVVSARDDIEAHQRFFDRYAVRASFQTTSLEAVSA